MHVKKKSHLWFLSKKLWNMLFTRARYKTVMQISRAPTARTTCTRNHGDFRGREEKKNILASFRACARRVEIFAVARGCNRFRFNCKRMTYGEQRGGLDRRSRNERRRVRNVTQPPQSAMSHGPNLFANRPRLSLPLSRARLICGRIIESWIVWVIARSLISSIYFNARMWMT